MTLNNIASILKNIEELMESGEYKKAGNYLVKIIEKDPKNPEPHYLMGEVLCKLEKFEASLVELNIANSLLPQNPQILHLFGWAHFMNKDIGKGRKLMETALCLKPDDILLLCDLAVLEMQDNNNKALEYSEKALKIAPHDPMVQEVFLVTNEVFQTLAKLKQKPN